MSLIINKWFDEDLDDAAPSIDDAVPQFYSDDELIVVDEASFDWYGCGPLDSDDIAVSYQYTSQFAEDAEWDDGVLYPDYWAQPPPIADVISDQVFVEDASNQQPENEQLEDWVESPLSADLQNQLYFTPLRYDYDPVDDLEVVLHAPIDSAVVVDQPPVEDASNQQAETEELEDWVDQPLPDSVVSDQVFVEDAANQQPENEELQDWSDQPLSASIISDQVAVEDASSQLEDEVEVQDWVEYQIPADVEAQLYFTPLGYDYDPVDDLEVVNNYTPSEAVVESDQVFVEDASNQQPENEQLEDWADQPLSGNVENQLYFNPLGYDYDPADDLEVVSSYAPTEAVVESNQVFVEDASNQQPEVEELQDWVTYPLSENIAVDNQLYFTPLGYDYDPVDVVEEFSNYVLDDAVLELNQLFFTPLGYDYDADDYPKEQPDFSDSLIEGYIDNQIFYVPSGFNHDPVDDLDVAETYIPVEVVVESNQVFVEDGSNYDVESDQELFGFADAPIAGEIVVESDQVFTEDGSNYDVDDDDLELFGFADVPATPDPVVESNQVFVEDGSNYDVNADIELYDFNYDLIGNDVSNQIFYVGSGFNYDPVDDLEGFSTSVIAEVVVESNQVFVEDGSNHDVESDQELFGFATAPTVPEIIVESNQVFVEDGSNYDIEGDQELFGFSYNITEDDAQNQIFYVPAGFKHDVDDDLEGFNASIQDDVAVESDQVFTEDGSNYDVEPDYELFGFEEVPGIDELVVESNQVFVEDGSDHDIEGDHELFGFDYDAPIDDVIEHRPHRPSRLKGIRDSSITLKSILTKSRVSDVTLEVKSFLLSTDPKIVEPVVIHVYVTPIRTRSQVAGNWVSVDIDISVEEIPTKSKVNDVVWILRYSRVRVGKIRTGSKVNKVNVSSSADIMLRTMASKTYYGDISVYGTKNPTAVEIAKTIAAIRKLRKKT